MIAGKQSIRFDKKVYISCGATVVGNKEYMGPLGGEFDIVVEDAMFGKNSWEEAESRMQHMAVDKLFIKSGLKKDDVRYVFAGDLLGQLIATTFGLKGVDIPVFGVYGACSTMGETIALSSIMIDGGYADNVIALASSHFASAEKQFRFPLAYGNQRPESATWTVTGAGAYMISGQCNNTADESLGKAVITGITVGKIVDYGVKDSMNMGACMAPAAASLIEANFNDFGIDENYYDLIITGDLGYTGRIILLDLLKEKGINIESRYNDCGLLIYDSEAQNTQSGGSGCGCSGVVLNAYILDKIRSKTLSRVLFIPTGAMLSPVSFNEGHSVPSVAHGIIIESE